MQARYSFTVLSTLLLLAGCVSSYQSVDEVPDDRRPAYAATYDYMQCSVDNLTGLLQAGKLPGGDDGERELEGLAARACEACGAELAAYSEYIQAKTGSQEVADAEAAKLQQRTREYMVRDILDRAAP